MQIAASLRVDLDQLDLSDPDDRELMERIIEHLRRRQAREDAEVIPFPRPGGAR